MFFFKRKKVVLDAFTTNVSYFEHAKPTRGTKFYPDWWKKTPNKVTEKTQHGIDISRDTIKTCSGFVDFYKRSIVLPFWSDLVIETRHDGSYSFLWADGESPGIVSHPPDQYGNNLPDLIHVKISTPWVFREKTGIYFVCVEPTWNYLDRNITMNILPGTIQFNINITNSANIFLPRDYQRLEFFFGDPLYHYIPLTENDVEIKHHLISEDEMNKLGEWSTHRFKFNNNYLFKQKMVKECPFKF